MIERLLNIYYKIAYRYFNLYREKVILCRDLTVVFDVKAFYDELEMDKINHSIEELQAHIKVEKELEASLLAKVTEFQRQVDYATSELMIELLELNRKLNPQTPDLDKLQGHYERIKSGQAEAAPKPKTDMSKELKKLYISLAKIYHPDKAPKGKEEEYAEIFKTIIAFKEAGDFQGLKAFAKGLKKHYKKHYKKGKKDRELNLKKLKILREGLVKQLKELIHSRKEFKKSDVYAEFLEYQRNPNLYINRQIDEIKMKIHNLQRELEMRELRENSPFGTVYNTRTFDIWR